MRLELLKTFLAFFWNARKCWKRAKTTFLAHMDALFQKLLAHILRIFRHFWKFMHKILKIFIIGL